MRQGMLIKLRRKLNNGMQRKQVFKFAYNMYFYFQEF